MKILTWNINCRAHKGEIPKMLVEELVKKNADVVCLTEFVKGENYHGVIDELTSLGYETFTDPRTEYSGNEVLIAIKNQYAVKTSTYIIDNDDSNPNFLHVVSTIKNNNYHFIGTRVKITSPHYNISKDKKHSVLIKEAKQRMSQVDSLLEYLAKLDGQICLMGDWNNYAYDESSRVNSWVTDKAFLQNYYSYPLLIEKMSAIGLTNYTPQGNVNKVYSWVNKKVQSDKRYIRNDHFFSNMKVKDVLYCWDFINSPDYIPDKVGFPDHAMLLGRIY